MISTEQKIKIIGEIGARVTFKVEDPRLPRGWKVSENPLEAAKNYAIQNHLKAKKLGKGKKITSGYLVEVNEGGRTLAVAVLNKKITVADASDLGLKVSKPGATKRYGKKELVA